MAHSRTHSCPTRLLPWSKVVNASCIAQAAKLLLRDAREKITGPLRPRLLEAYGFSLPWFASPSIEAVYVTHLHNETGTGFLVIVSVGLFSVLSYIAMWHVEASRPATADPSFDALLAMLALIIIAFIGLYARCLPPRVALWTRVIAYAAFSLLVHARAAWAPDLPSYTRSLGVWSITLKAAIACSDVGVARLCLFNLFDTGVNMVVVTVFRRLLIEDTLRWDVIVCIWFCLYACHVDVWHRIAFARAVEAHTQKLLGARSSQLHRFVVNHAPDIVAVHALPEPEEPIHLVQGRLLYVSAACETVLGLTADDLRGRSLAELIHPADIRDMQRVLLRAASSSVGSPSQELQTPVTNLNRASHMQQRVPSPRSGYAVAPLLSPQDVHVGMQLGLDRLHTLDVITDRPAVFPTEEAHMSIDVSSRHLTAARGTAPERSQTSIQEQSLTVATPPHASGVGLQSAATVEKSDVSDTDDVVAPAPPLPQHAYTDVQESGSLTSLPALAGPQPRLQRMHELAHGTSAMPLSTGSRVTNEFVMVHPPSLMLGDRALMDVMTEEEEFEDDAATPGWRAGLRPPQGDFFAWQMSGFGDPACEVPAGMEPMSMIFNAHDEGLHAVPVTQRGDSTGAGHEVYRFRVRLRGAHHIVAVDAHCCATRQGLVCVYRRVPAPQRMPPTIAQMHAGWR